MTNEFILTKDMTQRQMELSSVITRGISAVSPVTMPTPDTGFLNTGSQWILSVFKSVSMQILMPCSRKLRRQDLRLLSLNIRDNYYQARGA